MLRLCFCGNTKCYGPSQTIFGHLAALESLYLLEGSLTSNASGEREKERRNISKTNIRRINNCVLAMFCYVFGQAPAQVPAQLPAATNLVAAATNKGNATGTALHCSAPDKQLGGLHRFYMFYICSYKCFTCFIYVFMFFIFCVLVLYRFYIVFYRFDIGLYRFYICLI